MTRKFGKHLHATYGTLNSCFDVAPELTVSSAGNTYLQDTLG